MNILPARGCVYSVSSEGSGEGFYSVSGLTHGSSSGNGVILIHSVNTEDTDITSAVTTISGIRILYRFGKGVGNVRVTGQVLLGPAGSASSADAPSKLVDFYQTNRVSNKDTPTNVTLPGGKGLKVYFNSLVLGDTDPNTHTQPFVLIGFLADFE